MIQRRLNTASPAFPKKNEEFVEYYNEYKKLCVDEEAKDYAEIMVLRAKLDLPAFWAFSDMLKELGRRPQADSIQRRRRPFVELENAAREAELEEISQPQAHARRLMLASTDKANSTANADKPSSHSMKKPRPYQRLAIILLILGFIQM